MQKIKDHNIYNTERHLVQSSFIHLIIIKFIFLQVFPQPHRDNIAHFTKHLKGMAIKNKKSPREKLIQQAFEYFTKLSIVETGTSLIFFEGLNNLSDFSRELTHQDSQYSSLLHTIY